jgi:hypothetical protein
MQAVGNICDETLAIGLLLSADEKIHLIDSVDWPVFRNARISSVS